METARIAWIDDEKMILENVRMGMLLSNIPVDTFQDPSIVMEKIKNNQFDYDIVVTDMKMTEVSGIDIIRALRKHKDDTVVFVASGTVNSDIVEELRPFKIDDYFDKPFMMQTIIQTVKKRL